MKKYHQPTHWIDLIRSVYNSFNPLPTIKHSCTLCGNSSSMRICPDCINYFASPQYACQQCALPLKHHALLCGACLKKPPIYDDIYSPYLYQAPLSHLLNDYKHREHNHTGRGLSELFCESISSHYQRQHLSLPEWVVPVPLHWRQQWQRGFNQSFLFSQTISQNLGVRHFPHAKRVFATPMQKQLTRKQRLQNLRGCFKINKSLNGQSIAIVDDVMTTGATVNTLAKALKQAGAGKVTVWVLARTPI